MSAAISGEADARASTSRSARGRRNTPTPAAGTRGAPNRKKTLPASAGKPRGKQDAPSGMTAAAWARIAQAYLFSDSAPSRAVYSTGQTVGLVGSVGDAGPNKETAPYHSLKCGRPHNGDCRVTTPTH